MRLLSKLTATALVLALAACGRSPPPPSRQTARPVAQRAVPATPAPRPPEVVADSHPVLANVRDVSEPRRTALVRALMRQEDVEDEFCRDPWIGDETAKACNRRQALLNRLDRMGWCFGPVSDPPSSQQWMKCRDDPYYKPGRYAKPYFTNKEIRDLREDP